MSRPQKPKMPTEQQYRAIIHEEALADAITQTVCWWMSDEFRVQYRQSIRAVLQKFQQPGGVTFRVFDPSKIAAKRAVSTPADQPKG